MIDKINKKSEPKIARFGAENKFRHELKNEISLATLVKISLGAESQDYANEPAE